MKTKEKYDSLVFRLKCHLLRWGQCERGRRRKEDQDLTLGHIGFEILRCPNGRVKKAGPGTTLDIMDELRDLGEGEETMQLNLRKAALCLGVGGWGGGRAGWRRGVHVFAASVVHRHSAQHLVTGASHQPSPVGLILPGLQRRQQAQEGAKISSNTQLGSGNVRAV